MKYRSGHYIRPDARRWPCRVDEGKNHDFAVGTGISSRDFGLKTEERPAPGTEFIESLENPEGSNVMAAD